MTDGPLNTNNTLDQGRVLCWNCGYDDWAWLDSVANTGKDPGPVLDCHLCGGTGDLTDKLIDVFNSLVEMPEGERVVDRADIRLVAASVKLMTGNIAVFRPLGTQGYQVVGL